MRLLQYKPTLEDENSIWHNVEIENTTQHSVIAPNITKSPELVGIFGLFIDSVMRSIQRKAPGAYFGAARHGWPPKGRLSSCSMVSCVNDLLSDHEDHITDLAVEINHGNWQVQLAVAIELMSRKRFLTAYTYLRQSTQDLELLAPPYDLEYSTALVELVKCCNYLSRAAEGGKYALEAMKHSSFVRGSLSTHHLQVVFADSLIIQGKYTAAVGVLEDSHSQVDILQHLAVPVALRLNKVYRRLGRSIPSENLKNLVLRESFHQQIIETEIREEYLDEISATLYFEKQKNEDGHLQDSLLDSCMSIIKKLNHTEVWREKRLRDQIMMMTEPLISLDRRNAILPHRDSETIHQSLKPQVMIFLEPKKEFSPLLALHLRLMRAMIKFGESPPTMGYS